MFLVRLFAAAWILCLGASLTAGDANNPPPPLGIITDTVLHAPSGLPDSRRTVGVCEDVEVSLTNGELALFEFTDAKKGTLKTFYATKPTWSAPDVSATVTVTATWNSQEVTATIIVIPPTGKNWQTATQYRPELYQAAVFRLLPPTVNFGNIWSRERSGPAGAPGSGNPPTGLFATLPPSYYTTPPTSGGTGGISHDTNENWVDINETVNESTVPDLMRGAFPGVDPVTGASPVDGGFSWNIPNEYSGFADGSDPHHYVDELQAFVWTSLPAPLGTGTLTKGDLPPCVRP